MPKERLSKASFMKLSKEQLWVKYSREYDQIEKVATELDNVKQENEKMSVNAQSLAAQLNDFGKAFQDQKRATESAEKKAQEFAAKLQTTNELVGFLSKAQPIELVESVDDKFLKTRTSSLKVVPFKTYERFEIHDHDGKVFQTLIVLVIEELEDKIKALVVREISGVEEKNYLGKLVYITKEFQQKKLNWLQKLRLQF